MNEQEQRSAFEAWVTSPPYERIISRWPTDEYAWPGQYRDYITQLLWESWQAATARENDA